MEILHHPFQPVFDKHSEILVLGSFPSPKSRENEFYYGEKSNRFWGMLADVFEKPLPESKEDKMRLLLGNGVALWDIVGECDSFKGASDNDIKNPKPNGISEIIDACKIRRVLCNGKKAYDLFEAYRKENGLEVETIRLNSTSAANCRNCTRDQLFDEWGRAMKK